MFAKLKKRIVDYIGPSIADYLRQQGYKLDSLSEGINASLWLVNDKTSVIKLPRLETSYIDLGGGDGNYLYILLDDKIHHVKRDLSVLKHLQDIPQIPRFKKQFDIPLNRLNRIFRLSPVSLPAFEREYIDGLILGAWWTEANRLRGKLTDARQQKDLQELVREIHEKGVTSLDLEPLDVLIGSNNRIHLFDFGTCNIWNDRNPTYEKEKERDLINMERLFE